jgi:glycosyltransferase involved in cell wall biosynthesis
MDSYRVLFLTSSLSSGGAENHLLNLCRLMKSKGHETAVCTFSSKEDGLESSLLLEGIELNRVAIDSLSDIFFPGKISSLKRIVERFDPDILHAHLFHGEVLAWIASHFTRVPMLATRHSSGLEFKGWRGLIAGLMRRRVRALIAVSRGAADEARDLGYGERDIHLIPNAIDTDRFRPLGDDERRRRRTALLEEFFPGVAETTPIVGAVGRLKPVKNFHLLVKLAVRFGAEGGPAVAPRFVVFGDGPQREYLSRLIEEQNAGDAIALAGHSDRLEQVYPLFDLFVLPSRSEGTPMALLEAMSCRVACIASDVGGMGEAIGDAGMTVRSDDESGFASAIHDLIDQSQLRAELGRRARVRIMERYDIHAWGESILEVYRSMLGRNRSPSRS